MLAIMFSLSFTMFMIKQFIGPPTDLINNSVELGLALSGPLGAEQHSASVSFLGLFSLNSYGPKASLNSSMIKF